MKPNRFVLLFLIVAFPFLLVAQNAESRWSFGISFSPDYAYRYLHLDGDETINVAPSRNETESPRFGFSTGFVAKYQLNKKWALESGILFLDKGEKFDEFDFVASDELYGTEEQIDDPLIPESLNVKYHYYYLGIPLKLNYYFFQKKVRMFLSAGVSTDFFLSGKSKSVFEFSDRTESRTLDIDSDFNKLNFSGLAGVGFETTIASKTVFRFEPIFRYTFTPLVDAPLKEHPYSVGANIVLLRNW